MVAKSAAAAAAKARAAVPRLLRGACLCGGVRLRALGPPMQMTLCHCSLCRRAVGAAFQTWTSFPLSRVYFTHWSDLRSNELWRFCGRCGSTIAMHYIGDHWWSEAHTIWLSASILGPPAEAKKENNATFEDFGVDFDEGPGYPSHGPPLHIFTASKPRWTGLHDVRSDSGSTNATDPVLLRTSGHTWNELTDGEEVGPLRDLGRLVAPVPHEERFLLRGSPLRPDVLSTKGPTTSSLCCATPHWVEGA